MKKIISLFSLAILVPQAATAACYTAEQYRAEQVVRFHTQLMIIGMRCQRVLSPTAYADYQSFTMRNQTIIRAQENELVGYFRKAGKPNPEGAFHTFRTDLANKMSMQANGPAVVNFCRNYANQLQRAKTMQPVDFKKWVAKIDVKQASVSSQPLCAVAAKRTP